MEGLDRIPWKGELGQRIYDNVSKEAWKLWIEHSKMIMNEYRLNPLDPQSLKIMEEQLEQFFFGEGAKLPEGYVRNAPRASLSRASCRQLAFFLFIAQPGWDRRRKSALRRCTTGSLGVMWKVSSAWALRSADSTFCRASHHPQK